MAETPTKPNYDKEKEEGEIQGKTGKKGTEVNYRPGTACLELEKNREKKCLGTKKRLKQSVKGFLIQHNSSPRLVSGTGSPSLFCPF